MNWKYMFVLAVTGLMLGGCGSSEPVPELVQVSGTIKKDGKPLDGLRVKFMPNGLAGNKDARTSYGETDANGRYELIYQLPGNEQPGAAAGKHKVVLHDLKIHESRTEDDPGTVQSRISTIYISASSTNLQADLKPGEPNVVDFNVN